MMPVRYSGPPESVYAGLEPNHRQVDLLDCPQSERADVHCIVMVEIVSLKNGSELLECAGQGSIAAVAARKRIDKRIFRSGLGRKGVMFGPVMGFKSIKQGFIMPLFIHLAIRR